MPDTNTKNLDNSKQNEMHKKRSFFGWEINSKTKDLLDFRYNTQEEIDKLNEEMKTDDNVDDNQWENLDDRNDKDFESDSKWLEGSHIDNNENDGDENDSENGNMPIEWEILENIDEKENDNEDTELFNHEKNNTNDESIDVENNKIEWNNTVASTESNAKFFDPFELEFDGGVNDEEDKNGTNVEWDDSMFDPFRERKNENQIENFDEDMDNQNEKSKANNEIAEEDTNENEEDTDENEDDTDENEEDTNENEDDTDENEEIAGYNKESVDDSEKNIDDENTNEEVEYKEIEQESDEDIAEDIDENVSVNIPINIDQNAKNSDYHGKKQRNRKEKKYSANWQEITKDEIQLEQWQDMPNHEDEEEYQPSAEELFEWEPEFFADDELSQQFMHLVMNVRGIFKLERKDWQQNPYFKILWWKTDNSTLEYLFYLIEEENEPIDLYIKKVELNEENGEESEHLVQFSYNMDKELNVFVDEVILYERINKSEPNNVEYNDTKAILEKFIFLTENHYDKLKSELDRQREERRKKKQLQQIFKGF